MLLTKEVVTYVYEMQSKILSKEIKTYEVDSKEEAEELINEAERTSTARVTYKLTYKKATKKRDEYFILDITFSYEV